MIVLCDICYCLRGAVITNSGISISHKLSFCCKDTKKIAFAWEIMHFSLNQKLKSNEAASPPKTRQRS